MERKMKKLSFQNRFFTQYYPNLQQIFQESFSSFHVYKNKLQFHIQKLSKKSLGKINTSKVSFRRNKTKDEE